MNPTFVKRFQVLQDLLVEYEKELRGLTYGALNERPDSGNWSILEIVFHIMNAEKGIVKHIQKKILTINVATNSNIKSFFRLIFLRAALKSSRKFKAPPILDEPQGPYEKSTLFEEWKLIRVALEQTLESVPEEYVRKELFRHPVAGKLNLSQTLGFTIDHMKRHLQQIRKIKNSLL